jgi:aminoglycoside phosphotransferase (APT) family kinase protein
LRWDHLAVCVYPFPCDRQVSNLALIIDREKRALLLREIVPDHPELWQAALEPLGYKPEMHYVGKLNPIAAEPAILRVCREEALASVIRGAEAFVSRGPLRVSRAIGVSKRESVIVQEYLSGLWLGAAIHDHSLKTETMSIVGAALAELHAQETGQLMDRGPDLSAPTLLRWADRLGCLDADTGRYATAVARRVAARMADRARERQPTHGDFSANQVLLTDDRAGICDTETAALGDPTADLGSFIAYLEWRAVGGGLSDARVEAFREAFLSGYQHATQRSIAARVDLWVAAHLLRRAYTALRHLESQWPEKVLAALARAEIALGKYSRQISLRFLPTDGNS